MIWIIRQMPNTDQKFHHVLIFDGAGKSLTVHEHNTPAAVTIQINEFIINC
jgi:hypothetical protein